MVIGRVVGSIVSNHKEKLLEGSVFLVVEKVDATTMKGTGDHVIAIDAVGAGVGEIVFYVAGSSARMTRATEGRPADATITAIVDQITVHGKSVYTKDPS